MRVSLARCVAVLLVASFATLGFAGSASGTRGDSAVVPVSKTHTVTCNENVGSGVGPIPPGAVSLGPVSFLGLADSQSQTLTPGPNGLYAFKAYVVVRHADTASVEVRVASVSGGRVGLDYSSHDRSSFRAGTYRLGAAQDVELLRTCGGSAGYAGGFIFSGPTCVRLTVTTDTGSHFTRSQFGNQPCPSDQSG